MRHGHIVVVLTVSSLVVSLLVVSALATTVSAASAVGTATLLLLLASSLMLLAALHGHKVTSSSLLVHEVRVVVVDAAKVGRLTSHLLLLPKVLKELLGHLTLELWVVTYELLNVIIALLVVSKVTRQVRIFKFEIKC